MRPRSAEYATPREPAPPGARLFYVNLVVRTGERLDRANELNPRTHRAHRERVEINVNLHCDYTIASFRSSVLDDLFETPLNGRAPRSSS